MFEVNHWGWVLEFKPFWWRVDESDILWQVMGSGVIHECSTLSWVEDKKRHGLPHFTILKANDCIQSVLNNKAFIRSPFVNEELLTWIKQHQLYSFLALSILLLRAVGLPSLWYLVGATQLFFHFKFVYSNVSLWIDESRLKK